MAKSYVEKIPITKPQTGIGIKRSGNTITVSWKIADKDYGKGQWIKWSASGMKKTQSGSGKPGKTAKSYSFNITPSLFNPTKTDVDLTNIHVELSAKRNPFTKKIGKETVTIAPEKSEWVWKDVDVKPPSKPSLTVTKTSSNRTTFSWEVPNSSSDKWTWFTQIRYQSVTVDDYVANSGSVVSWENATSTTSTNPKTSKYYDEPSLAKNFVRWFRIRAEGLGGNSDWVYGKRIFSEPIKGVIDPTSTASKNSANGVDIKAVWKSDVSKIQPIESTTLQYIIDEPSDGTLSTPSGTEWKDIIEMRDTSGNNSYAGTVDEQPGIDECMWIRVINTYDNRETEGDPFLVLKGGLTAPTSLTPHIVESTHRGTIEVPNFRPAIDGTFVVVRFTSETESAGINIAIIPYGQTESDIIQFPDWGEEDHSFSVYSVVGTYELTPREDGITSYAIYSNMESDIVTDGGRVPKAPTGVTLSKGDAVGMVNVHWNWAWDEADSIELSWSDDRHAWDSTNSPSTYVVDGTYASQWNIAGLATGKVWYIRARFISHTSEDKEVYSSYSTMQEINLSSAPAIPMLTLAGDRSVYTLEDTLTASWGYSSTDGTLQAFAELADVTEEDGQLVYTSIAQTDTPQHISIPIKSIKPEWNAGEVHRLAVRVVSASGHKSEGWSNIMHVVVAEPLNAVITQHSFVEELNEQNETVYHLDRLPLTVTVTGAGNDGYTTIAIERLEPYEIDRPDGSIMRDGFANETIYLLTKQGEDQFEINREDLIGRLDDGAQYRLVVTIKDSLGQISEPEPLDFDVDWDHKAIIPDAIVTIDDTNLIAEIIPVAVEGMEETDFCDIYRLSADKPKLIYQNAQYGETYIDPYPTIGETGGYRFLCRTEYGDYITEENELAWYDVEAYITSENNIIDFGKGRVMFSRNIDLSSSWEKDFQETRYLGGSIQGDWNAGVSRQSEIGTVSLTLIDQETISSMRQLAEYANVCHVRTGDGSNYTADVQVSEERGHDTGNMVVSFSLNLTRVDSDVLDLLTLDEYEEEA